jgi:ATP-binding cassette, subfamily C (CFTR/MRP), member 10
LSVDARQIPDIFASSHALISLPLQIFVALLVLWWQVQAAFVAGLLLVVALIPVNRLLTSMSCSASQRMMVHKDRRLDVMSTLLENLRSLFMLGWQPQIQKQVLSRAPAVRVSMSISVEHDNA